MAKQTGIWLLRLVVLSDCYVPLSACVSPSVCVRVCVCMCLVLSIC